MERPKEVFNKELLDLAPADRAETPDDDFRSLRRRLPVSEDDDAVLSFDRGWTAQLSRTDAGVRLRVRQGDSSAKLELTIVITPEGPVLRAHASALEVETDNDLVARCGTFRVEARDRIELVAGGVLQAAGRRVDVEATHGSARVRANDDVQLLGENVLLNCEGPNPEVPSWAAASPSPPVPSLPPATASGDTDLLLR